MANFDTVIRAASIVDGTGSVPYTADLGITDGRVTEIGTRLGSGKREFQADGATLTPGFVDIHTHYDGQASWDETFEPSVYHGVTTLVMGNCGVGFAPVRPGKEQVLLDLMEGVEEIPGSAMAEGIRWGWEHFKDYTQALNAQPHSLDFMALVPHDCLRLYVMGERAVAREAASSEDIAAMHALLKDALQQGAAGLSLGRSDTHRTAKGAFTPSADATKDELVGITSALKAFKHRVLHIVSDFDAGLSHDAGQQARFDAEYALLEAAAAASGQRTAFTWLDRVSAPDQAAWLAEKAQASLAKGIPIYLQTACRGIGVLSGLQSAVNLLLACPAYREIAHLPLAQRAKALKDPAIRLRILTEPKLKLSTANNSVAPLADYVVENFAQVSFLMFPFAADKPVSYAPDPSSSFGAQAKALSKHPFELMLDYLSANDGANLIYFPIFNYLGGSLDRVGNMLHHPQALFSLADAGAHVGSICDASMFTTLLNEWVAKRSMPLERAVQMMTQRNARHMGLTDRGEIKVGMRADLNLIDLPNLTTRFPEYWKDLPAGGTRLMQQAQGYIATWVNGQTVQESGALTTARPGKWVAAL